MLGLSLSFWDPIGFDFMSAVNEDGIPASEVTDGTALNDADSFILPALMFRIGLDSLVGTFAGGEKACVF
jgi:hypothetical protein